jgi:hypothetical protein
MIFNPSLVVILSGSLLFTQGGPDIRGYLARIEAGETDDVREEVLSLADRYPGDPGVLYLRGRVTTDGAEAVRIYQGIVDSYPRSEWADDALYRVYQFYYAIGLYRTAELKMAQLRKEYPNSPYLSEVTEVDTRQLAEERAEQPAAPNQGGSAVDASISGGNLPRQEGQFALQVGAYAARENAENQKLFFEGLGYPVEIINRMRDSRSLFLVLVGNYLTYEEAKAKAVEFHKNYNMQSFVVSR